MVGVEEGIARKKKKERKRKRKRKGKKEKRGKKKRTFGSFVPCLDSITIISQSQSWTRSKPEEKGNAPKKKRKRNKKKKKTKSNNLKKKRTIQKKVSVNQVFAYK